MLTGGIININCLFSFAIDVDIFIFSLVSFYIFFPCNIPIFLFIWVSVHHGKVGLSVKLFLFRCALNENTLRDVALLQSATPLYPHSKFYDCAALNLTRSEISVAHTICATIKTRAFEVAKFNWRVAEIISRTWYGNAVYIFVKYF